jgi:hypothetical protein
LAAETRNGRKMEGGQRFTFTGISLVTKLLFYVVANAILIQLSLYEIPDEDDMSRKSQA